jgi:hypothetical protein
MKRLVELNPKTYYSLEVDQARLLREARDLQQFLMQLPPGRINDMLRRKVLPFTSAALKGALKVPLDPGEGPIDFTRFEDLHEESPPSGFEHVYACFFNTAIGARSDVENKVTKDGKLWAWMDFE